MNLRLPIQSLLVVLFFFFLPFERLLTFEIAGLTAKISFAILMLLVLWLIAVRPGPKLALEEKILLGFVAWSYVGVFWSIDQLRSFIIATIFLATFLGFIALRRFLDEKTASMVKTIIIFWGFVLSLFALWQYFGGLRDLPLTFLRPQYSRAVFGFPRPQATFLEPLYFANFLFLPLFLTFERLIEAKKPAWLYWLGAFLMTLVLVLTLSRGAYIAFIFAALVFSVLIWLKFKQYLKKLALIAGVTVLGAIAGVLLIYATASKTNFKLFVVHAGIGDVSTGESSLDRLSFAGTAWSNFLHKPWGIGAGAFGALPEFYQKLSAGSYQTVGNLYLEVLVEEGAVGLLLFLIFLLMMLKHFWEDIKNKKLESLIYLTIFLAVFVQAIFFSALYIIPIWAFLALSWRKNQ